MNQLSRRFLIIPVMVAMIISTFVFSPTQVDAAQYTSSVVSTAGTDNTLANSNTGRKVATNAHGHIFVAYHSATRGIRVARSINRGQGFHTDLQIADENGDPDIAVDPRNSNIYLTWVNFDTRDVRFSRSTDNGLTFSTPVTVGNDLVDSVHLAALSPYVYILLQNGTKVYINDANGVGAFSSSTVDDTGRVFADIGVDPYTETVYVQDDDPNVIYFSSTNHGASFTAHPQPIVDIYYSTSAFAFTETIKYMYSAGGGGDISASIRVNLNNDSFISIPVSATWSNQSRSLTADSYGNVISTFRDLDNDARFEVSNDYGVTFQSPTTVINGSPFMSTAINSQYGDIVVAYENAGRIYVTVYENQLIGYTSASSRSSGSGSSLPPHAFLPPNRAGVSFSINNDQPTTSDSVVTLNLKAGTEVTKMAVSATSDFKNANLEPVATTRSWQLCNDCQPGSTYTVYAQLYTEFGQFIMVSDQITYVAPAVSITDSTLPVGGPTPTPVSATPTFVFKKDLRLGMRHPDVIQLQRYLNAHGFPVATSGPGSLGKEIDTFGPATKRALIRFQTAHTKEILTPAGLTTATGIFGAITRNYFNQHP